MQCLQSDATEKISAGLNRKEITNTIKFKCTKKDHYFWHAKVVNDFM